MRDKNSMLVLITGALFLSALFGAFHVYQNAAAQTTGEHIAWTGPEPTPPPPVETGFVPPPVPSSVVCPVPFSDVSPEDWHFGYIEYIFCKGVVQGYNSSPPCETGMPCFRPNDYTSRGQAAKIVANLFEVEDGLYRPFSYVRPGSPFFSHISGLRAYNLVHGYPEQTFRPGNTVTRGQLAKLIVSAAIFRFPQYWSLLDPPTATFEDVPVGSTFFRYAETAAAHSVLAGYACGGPGEPCGVGNKPYLRVNHPATRAQLAKMGYIAYTLPAEK